MTHDDFRERPRMIVVAAAPDAATRWADAADVRVIGPFAPGDADGRMEMVVAAEAVLVDLRTMGADAARMLADRAIAVAGSLSARVIPVCGIDQLDAALGTFSDAELLLCDPRDDEAVAAITLALAPRRLVLNDVARESESERLRRLNAEVARIARVLTALSEGVPAGEAHAPVADAAPAPADAPARAIAPAMVRAAIRARRMRDQYLPADLFADPAWDMLLDLFAAELERGRVSVSSLCIAAAVPPTTALRWITILTDHGLIDREPDPFDRRRAFVKLTARASVAMRAMIDNLLRAGLPIP